MAIFLYLTLLPIAQAERGVTFFSDDQIILPNGYRTTLSRVGDDRHELSLIKDGQVIWSKTMEHDFGRIWSYAYFTPIKRAKIPAHDINNDSA